MTIPILSMRSEIRALPRGAWILYAETLVNRLGTFVLVFLVLWLTRIGWSAGMAGLAVSVYGLGGLFASLAGGWLADRFGRRRTIALSMFSSAVVVLSLPHARGVAAVLTLAGLAGLTSELYRPAASGLLSDLIPAGRRIPGFAIYRLAVNLGHGVGPAIGGFVAERAFVWVFVADGAWGLTHSLGIVFGPGLGTALYAVSPGGLWSACAAVGLAGALLVLVSPRPRPAELSASSS